MANRVQQEEEGREATDEELIEVVAERLILIEEIKRAFIDLGLDDVVRIRCARFQEYILKKIGRSRYHRELNLITEVMLDHFKYEKIKVHGYSYYRAVALRRVWGPRRPQPPLVDFKYERPGWRKRNQRRLPREDCSD